MHKPTPQRVSAGRHRTAVFPVNSDEAQGKHTCSSSSCTAETEQREGLIYVICFSLWSALTLCTLLLAGSFKPTAKIHRKRLVANITNLMNFHMSIEIQKTFQTDRHSVRVDMYEQDCLEKYDQSLIWCLFFFWEVRNGLGNNLLHIDCVPDQYRLIIDYRHICVKTKSITKVYIEL